MKKITNFKVTFAIIVMAIILLLPQIEVSGSTNKPPKWKVWKTIKIGGQVDSLLYGRIKTDPSFSGWKFHYMPEINTSSKEGIINLVLVSVADLGFKDKYEVIYDDLVIAAANMGLKLCPAEVGPQLRLQYGRQPKDQWLYIMMLPIFDSPLNNCDPGKAHIFNVANMSEGPALLGREFYVNNTNILYFFQPTDLLVFQL